MLICNLVSLPELVKCKPAPLLKVGLVVPIPTLLVEESTNKVPLSQFKSPVPPVRAVRVPRLVILGWAAVASVPVIEVFAVKVVKVPAAGVVPPITELSITAPSRLIATDVPVALKIASTVSKSVLILPPQVSVDAPTSGLV